VPAADAPNHSAFWRPALAAAILAGRSARFAASPALTFGAGTYDPRWGGTDMIRRASSFAVAVSMFALSCSSDSPNSTDSGPQYACKQMLHGLRVWGCGCGAPPGGDGPDVSQCRPESFAAPTVCCQSPDTCNCYPVGCEQGILNACSCSIMRGDGTTTCTGNICCRSADGCRCESSASFTQCGSDETEVPSCSASDVLRPECFALDETPTASCK
jgi:hypothetical protein